MFKVTIEEFQGAPEDGQAAPPVKRYEQTVDVIDMKRVMAAVNHKPRAPRKPRNQPEK